MFLKRIKSMRGFTLLEMLIAIAIFAMLGLAANTVLSTVMQNDTATRDFAAKLKAMQQGFGIIERDLNQMVARTPRLLEGGRGTTVFQTGSNMLDSESESLVFFRLGWLNPDGLLPRGSLQSVAYVVIEGQLQRWYYPYPEPEFGAEPIKTVIMDKVISVEYAFFADDKWERKTDATKLPKAIAIEIEFEDIGKVQRKFLVPKGALAGSNDDSNNGGNNNGGNNNGDDNKDDSKPDDNNGGGE
ncbi:MULTISPECIES: type II secretion system minor pseudopilin GspJ [Shewanella]|uniref:Type II secretion system protein J n=1 Tax=Shewanella fidelis TaxID=173509 RepID=A0AAW8NSC6_9GAMM|nr:MULTISPECIES: type II secretion system minor pseudopilin GspJ [Shewanella]MDR8525998.1 type II secretion system minor pseudopilin GspJ [Shewanella fidelis]MDW4813814.1 type II secretion system minor pseudopilin GspJ [Shewanella fidelis]MDW4817994.1 type II secretion system minor pseudopilin GspJ [Shewanella fidelis]MDW4822061.1 type II secretion system minor pseudopilin GspJ [Shewanella fidelis]MDW4826226.1 type II secretion system minor pseudopilin GspJ [Shewanella fidelis]